MDTDKKSKSVNSTLSGAKKHRLKNSETILNKSVLLILSENYFGNSFIIDKPEIVIGRAKDCDLCIGDSFVSMRHCRIEIDEDGKFYIEDLDSKNFTYLNRKQIKKKIHLLYGDRIVIGNTILRFFLEEQIE